MPTKNEPSVLLKPEENQLIFSLLGLKCCSLVTTVVQRYISGGRTGTEDWVFSDVGILCLVKDNTRRSYFFRIYCPNKKQLIWEHELYNYMDYFKINAYLHAFEAEEYIVGFNFANEDEGEVLHSTVKEKLENKRQRRLEKRSRSSHNIIANNNNNNNNVSRVKPTVGQEGVGMGTPLSQGRPPPPRNIQSYASKTKQKVKLSKDMIGQPQDFRHISHVGWDPDSGFNLDQVNDTHLEEFFRKAGVSESQLKDPDTRGFIYQFIEDHGGMEAVKTDLAPPVPARSKQQPQQGGGPPQPPPPPPTRTLPPRAPPPPSSLQAPAPPPPPPPPLVPPPPAPSSLSIPSPPPLSSAPPAPAPPVDSRSALMQAIRSGTSLKPVSSSGTKQVESTRTDSGSARGELLEQIRHGVKLNSVPKNEEGGLKARPVEGGLATALADALAKRAMVIQSDTSSSSSSDNDEWDDD